MRKEEQLGILEKFLSRPAVCGAGQGNSGTSWASANPGLHEMVNHLRQEGHPIGSSQNGYFYAETASEVYVTIQNLEENAGRFGCGSPRFGTPLDSSEG